MAQMKPLQKLGELEVLEIPGSPTGPYVIVFHGYGANAYDLLSFAQLLGTPPGTGWIFAQGPLRVSDGGISGRAWFPIDVAALDQAMQGGTHYDFSQTTPEGLRRARAQATEMIKALGVPFSRLVLLGFSQGAMLATDLALRFPEKIAGLAILSGTLLNRDLWLEKAKTKAGLRFFQSHGDQDALLGIEYARNLEQVLLEGGLKGKLETFRGGHEVPQETIYKLNSFLKNVLVLQN